MHLKKRKNQKKQEDQKKQKTIRSAAAALSGEGAALLCAFFYQNVHSGNPAGTILVFLFFSAATEASVNDLNDRKIPNHVCRLIVGITITEVFLIPEIRAAERALGAAAIGSLMLAAALILPGVFGGGDIKLMAACGGFLGWEMIRDAFVTAVIAAVLAVFLLRVKEREYRTGIAMAPFFELGMVLHFLRN